MQIKTLKKVSFGGTRHNAGDCFEVDEKMGNHLIANKLAEKVITKETVVQKEAITTSPVRISPPVATEPTTLKEEIFHNKRKKR